MHQKCYLSRGLKSVFAQLRHIQSAIVSLFFEFTRCYPISFYQQFSHAIIVMSHLFRAASPPSNLLFERFVLLGVSVESMKGTS
jgi:hypothetical protein